MHWPVESHLALIARLAYAALRARERGCQNELPDAGRITCRQGDRGRAATRDSQYGTRGDRQRVHQQNQRMRCVGSSTLGR